MTDFFIIEEGIVKPAPEMLLVSPFKEIWNRDKTERKDVALKELAYIFFLCSQRKTNVYAGYTDNQERHQKIIKGVFKDMPEWIPDKLVLQAVEDFLRNQDEASPTLRYFLSTRKALETLRDYWNSLDMTKETRTGQLVNKPSDVARGLEQTANLLIKFTELEKKIQQETLSSSKTRGNRQINPLER